MKYLDYNFTQEQISDFKKLGVINGCGGEGYNIDELIERLIYSIPNYDKEKGQRLFANIEMFCNEHDFDFYHQKGFYKSNYKFAKKIYKLLRSAKIKWVGMFKSFMIALSVFIFLSKYGKKFYYNITKL